MIKILLSFLIIMSINGCAKEKPMNTIYDFKVKTINGKETTLEPYKGKVMLIVNVASQCGFTSQYAGLEALWKNTKTKVLLFWAFHVTNLAHKSQEPKKRYKIFVW